MRGHQQHAAAPGISPQVGFAPKRFSVFVNDLQEHIKPSLLLSAGETKLGKAENNEESGSQPNARCQEYSMWAGLTW